MPLLCARSPSPAPSAYPTLRKQREGWGTRSFVLARRRAIRSRPRYPLRFSVLHHRATVLPQCGFLYRSRVDRRAAHEGHVMKKLFVLATILLPFALAGCSHPQPASYYPPPPPPAYSQVAEQGHHDGIEAARRDISNGAPPDPARHPRFRNPPVPPPLMEDYRHAFRNGYEEVYRHGPPPGY